MNKNLKYFLFFLIFSALSIARNSFGVVVNMGIETMPHDTGPMLLNGMLHAWASLAAAIAIFALALKYMVGGKLSRPNAYGFWSAYRRYNRAILHIIITS